MGAAWGAVIIGDGDAGVKERLFAFAVGCSLSLLASAVRYWLFAGRCRASLGWTDEGVRPYVVLGGPGLKGDR